MEIEIPKGTELPLTIDGEKVVVGSAMWTGSGWSVDVADERAKKMLLVDVHHTSLPQEGSPKWPTHMRNNVEFTRKLLSSPVGHYFTPNEIQRKLTQASVEVCGAGTDGGPCTRDAYHDGKHES